MTFQKNNSKLPPHQASTLSPISSKVTCQGSLIPWAHANASGSRDPHHGSHHTPHVRALSPQLWLEVA